MKYQIADLLNGAEADRAARMKSMDRKIKAAERELRQAEEKFQQSVDQIVPYLTDANKAITTHGVTIEEEYEALRALDHQISRSIRFGDVRYAQKKFDALIHEQANLEAGTKSELELWLISLKDHGETTVSSHGVKSAGFNEGELTRYVTAVRKLEQEETLDRHPAFS